MLAWLRRLALWLLGLLALLHPIGFLASRLLDSDGLLLCIHAWVKGLAYMLGVHGSQVAELVDSDGILLLSLQATDFGHHAGTLGFPVELDRSPDVLIIGESIDGRNQAGILLLLHSLLCLLWPLLLPPRLLVLAGRLALLLTRLLWLLRALGLLLLPLLLSLLPLLLCGATLLLCRASRRIR